MTITVQQVIVAVVVVLAFALMARAIWRVLSSSKRTSPTCAACPLAGHCKQQNEDFSKNCDQKVAWSRNKQ